MIREPEYMINVRPELMNELSYKKKLKGHWSVIDHVHV
jgi:hypothetical protein